MKEKFREIKFNAKNLILLEDVKEIKKIINNPEIGKPMRNVRKGTREVYIDSFRLSYAYHGQKDLIEFLDIYPKKKQ